MSLWSFIKSEATQNLNSNPSFEKDTAGYTAVAGGTLSRSTEQRAVGIYSGKYIPTSNTGDGIYRAVTLQAGTPHTFGLSFYGVLGVPYRAYFYDVVAGVILGTPVEFTGAGSWKRQVVTATIGLNTNCRVYVVKNGSGSTGPFYVDALHIAAKDHPETYCDGDQDGCAWDAGAHSSSSSRSAQSAAGGRVVDFDDDGTLAGFHIEEYVGVGDAPKEIIDTLPAQGDGGDYQRTITRPRQFQFLGTIQGQGADNLAARKNYHQKRNNLISAFSVERLATEQPVQIRYSLDGRSVAIDAFEEGGLEKGPFENALVEKAALRFKAEDPYWRGVPGVENGASGGGAGGGQGSVISGVQESIASVNYIIQRAANGQWSAMGTGLTFPVPGVVDNGSINAILFGPDGYLYVVGSFTSMNGVANTRGIAKWDGTQWSAVGSGADNGSVEAIVFDDAGNIYIGGTFSAISGVANTVGIAKWTGSAWVAVGTGVTGGVNQHVAALAWDSVNGHLWAGGRFDEMGGVANTNKIAKWTGSAWTAAGTGVTGGTLPIIFDLTAAVSVNPSVPVDIYVGGDFTQMGGVANTENIARWDGSAWFAVGTGAADGQVNCLATKSLFSDDPDYYLYVGGTFTGMGGVANTNTLARWNIANSTWESVATGTGGFIDDIALTPDGFYLCGGFTSLFGTSGLNRIAQYQDGQFLPLGSGLDASADGLFLNQDGNLYVCGSFGTIAGTSGTLHLARWTGVEWRNIVLGTKGVIQGVDGSIYVIGAFTQAGGLSDAKRVAKWSPSAWAALSTGANGMVHAIARAPNGDIYIGGAFTSVGGVANTKGVARWDGTNWNALSTGISGTVHALAFAPDGDLYVGGLFKDAAGVANTKNITRWDGAAFNALSTGANDVVSALAIDVAGSVYIGGRFTKLGSVTANYLGKWNGSAFSAAGSGINGFVYRIVIQPDGSLIIGGAFTQAGGVTVNHIARWNGSTFFALSTGVNDNVYALAISPDSKVFLGGAFTQAGGLPLSDKGAIFIGSTYAPLPVDLPGNAAVEAILATAGGQIYMGFDTAGTVIAAGIS